MTTGILPSFIKHRRGSISFSRCKHTGKPFADERSFFRCFALHLKARQLEANARELGLALTNRERGRKLAIAAQNTDCVALLHWYQWLDHERINEAEYRGVGLEEMNRLVDALDVNIFVYRYSPPPLPKQPFTDSECEVGSTTVGEGVTTDLTEQIVTASEGRKQCYCVREYEPRMLRDRSNGTMSINIYTDENGRNHFSYIFDVKRFKITHRCERCEYVFATKRSLRQHQTHRPDCGSGGLHKFPGNAAIVTPTIFERLDEINVRVDNDLRFYPYFAIFDWESCQDALRIAAEFKHLTKSNVNISSVIREDPPRAVENLRPCDRYNWQRIRARIDPQLRFCVIRNARLDDVKQVARLLAEEQRERFDMTVTLLRRKRKLIVDHVVAFASCIDCEEAYEKAAGRLLSPQALKSDFVDVAAVRIEMRGASFIAIKTPQLPVSVAIASNIEGLSSSFLCRTSDSYPIERLVKDFVDHLHSIQTMAASMMHVKFKPTFACLDTSLSALAEKIIAIFASAKDGAKKRLTSLESEIAALNLAYLEASCSADRSTVLSADKIYERVLEKEAAIPAMRRNLKILLECNITRDSILDFRMTKRLRSAMLPDDISDYYLSNHDYRTQLGLKDELKSFCEILPVFGFNSGSFDIPLIREWLLPYLQCQQKESICPLKKGASRYLQLKTNRLRFLDAMNFVAPATTYAAFIKTFTSGEQAKGIFCYEYLARPSQLLETQLPPREAFNSSLRGTVCSVEEYAEVQRVWREHRMQTLEDYLRYYNLLDVEPFVEALGRMRQFWQDHGHDMFNNVCTLPGLADRFARKNFLPKHANLVLPQKIINKAENSTIGTDNSDLYYLLKRSVIGGPSGPYHRLHIAGETKIRGGPEICRRIVGIDCNGLYTHSSAQEMPTQVPVRYYKNKPTDQFFKRRSLYRYSKTQLEWLEWMSHSTGKTIRHQFNSATPPFVAGQHPDGFHPETKTVYYLDGCRFHGHGGCCANPRCEYPDDVDPKKKAQKDFAIRRNLRARGYEVVSIRECEWMQQKRENKRASELDASFIAPLRVDGSSYDPKIRDFLAEHITLPAHGRMTEAVLISEVRRGRFFGIVVCDIEVPEELREHFADFEPIFKNVEVARENLGEKMREFAESTRSLRKPRRTLVNSFFAKDFVLTTPLAVWYLNHGLRISNVTQAFEWKPKRLFQHFAETVAEKRRHSDKTPGDITGDLYKLIANSIYGKSITDVDQHITVKVCDERQRDIASCNPKLIKRIDPIGDNGEYSEVYIKKRSINHTLFTAFGAFVYQYSKLRMLQTYYDFVDFYWERKDFQLMYMDTDSFYFAISSKDLSSFIAEKIRPLRKHLFDSNYPEQFLAREDATLYSADDIKWDRRTCGLFKVEKEARRMCALNSKSCICTDVGKTGYEEAVVKISAKGVGRSHNELTWQSFFSVLSTKNDFVGMSRTLKRPHGEQRIYRIDTKKRCLSYGFYKRLVADDGISTSPLGL